MVGIYVSREQDLIIRDYFRREPEVKLALDFPQVFFSEPGIHYVSQAGFKRKANSAILLPLLPKLWDYSCELL